MAKTKRVRLVSDDIRCRQNAAQRPDALGSERVLAIAIIFCCVMVVVEGVGGFMAHSLAVMSDAVHMLADVFALSISLFSARAAKWGADSRRTFGWRRAEVIGALASIFTTWFLVVWIVFSAVERTVSIIRCAASPDHHGRCEKLDAPMMLGLGAFGLAMNIVLATILFCGGGGHAHSHGSLSHNDHSHEHSHGAASVCMEMMQETGQSREELTSAADTDACVCDHDHDHDHDHNHHDHAHAHGGGGNSSMNVRAALLHVIGDCLQAVGVVVAAGVAWIGNVHVYGSSRQAHSYFNLADPLLSFWFGVLTILTTRSLLVEVLEVLMEEVPRNMCYASLVDEMEEVEEVVAVEDLHVWTVGPSFVMACAEVSVDAEQIQTLNHAEKLTQHLQEHLRAQGIQHATIQLVANHGRRTNIIEEDGIPEERSSPL